MTTKSTIGIYVRVSTKHQADEGFSLEEQKESLVQDAESRGYDWVMFEDAGISGQALANRPAAVDLLSRIESGELIGVLSRFNDRLYRSDVAMAEMLVRLTQAGAKLIEYGGSQLDLTNPSDALQAWVKGIFSVHDQAQRTQRMVAGLRRTVEAGFWPGGPAPYGYRLVSDPQGSKHKVLELDEGQAMVLRRAVHLILEEGHSTYSACKILNTEGARTERGSLWRHSNLRGHLRKPHLTGTWTYRPRDVDEIKMHIPSVLDQETWDQLQRAIKGNPRPQQKHRTYPLTGRERNHLRCSCGGNYSGKTDSTRRFSVYVCSGSAHEWGVERCPHSPRSLRRVDIEKATIEQIRPVFTPSYLRQLAEFALPQIDDVDYDSQIRSIGAQVGRRRDEKVQIARTLAENNQMDFLNEAISEIDAEIDALRKQQQELLQNKQLRVNRASVMEQVEVVAGLMAKKLDHLDDEEYAQLADILQLDLERLDSHRFVGSASIPLPIDGEIGVEGPRPHAPHRRRSCPAASPASSLRGHAM